MALGGRGGGGEGCGGHRVVGGRGVKGRACVAAVPQAKGDAGEGVAVVGCGGSALMCTETLTRYIWTRASIICLGLILNCGARRDVEMKNVVGLNQCVLVKKYSKQ